MPCTLATPCGNVLRVVIVTPDRTIRHCLNAHRFVEEHAPLTLLPPSRPRAARSGGACRRCHKPLEPGRVGQARMHLACGVAEKAARARRGKCQGCLAAWQDGHRRCRRHCMHCRAAVAGRCLYHGGPGKQGRRIVRQRERRQRTRVDITLKRPREVRPIWYVAP